MTKFLYYLAEDDVKSSRGEDEDDACEAFVREHDQQPLRVLGVTKDDGGSVEGTVVWENDDLDEEEEEP
jgi:hypothetical protein